MGSAGIQTPETFGFLTVVKDDRHGMFGGFLTLNASGRPLEFHCTAPVKPNRAQQILYGPTLDDYLYGEQIGKTLVAQAATVPSLLLTDLAACAGVQEFIATPLVLVLDDNAVAAGRSAARYRVDDPHERAPAWKTLRRDGYRLTVPLQSAPLQPNPSDASAEQSLATTSPETLNHAARIERMIDSLGASFDFLEPFSRIREALNEAHGGAA